MSNTLKTIATIVGIVSGILGVFAYFQSRTPTISAEHGSVAGGRDVTITGDRVVNKFDFDARTRDEAVRYVRVSSSACSEMRRKVEGIQADSAFRPGDNLIPVEFQPQQYVADYYGNDAFAKIKAMQDDLVAAAVAFNKPLMMNMITAITDQVPRQGNEAVGQMRNQMRAEFPAAKAKFLEVIGNVCMYFDELKQRG